MRWLPTIFVCFVAAAASKIGAEGLLLELGKAQEDREQRLTGYSVTEHYQLTNNRFKDMAEAVVKATYTRGVGKTYQVISRTGPPFLQSHVIDKILKEEQDMSKGEKRKSALITSANYEIEPVGKETIDGRLCDAVELTPRVKSPHVLKGKAWFDAASHLLVRIEGRPTAAPAFLAGIPAVVREYYDIDGFSMARVSHAKSQTFLFGKTELTISYMDYRVNGSGTK